MALEPIRRRLGGDFDGVDEVLHNLNREIERIEGKTLSGILKAALFVRGEAQKNCPKDLGNLINSAYVVASDGEKDDNATFKSTEEKKRNLEQLESDHAEAISESRRTQNERTPSADVGFSANYAVYVHEMNKRYVVGHRDTETGVVKRSLRKGWKFLERALLENRDRILRIIANEARID